MAAPDYTTFLTGLAIKNAWRGHIRGVNWHSNIGNFPGSTFVTLSGRTIDTRIESCNADGVDRAVLVSGYSEGIHITDSVLIGNVAVSTGTAPYSGDGVTIPFINVLGLYISGCEFNNNATAANLFMVDEGWITGNHFGVSQAPSHAAQFLGCSKVLFYGNTLSGCFNPANPQNCVGVFTGGVGSWPSDDIMVDNCNFRNLGIGVQHSAGTINSTAFGIRMLTPNEGFLLSTRATYGNFVSVPYVNTSGSTTNHGEWVASTPALSLPSDKQHFSVP